MERTLGTIDRSHQCEASSRLQRAPRSEAKPGLSDNGDNVHAKDLSQTATLPRFPHFLRRFLFQDRISTTHPSEKRASKSDCERAVSNSNPRVEMGILKSRTQLSAINPRIEGSIIRSSEDLLSTCTVEAVR
ncbi:hypothetical protein DPX16_6220 [Anabarilius grahami]|uniref:Uncharacterized protein n=1 Tax=Anabarilius grahami TaxID=495550 RepID=A0A3N0Z1V7_ANAGA|nr:hypothetical protein DPX16_6220 [Anabarilius grahami]